jgi:8-oxo-dGTP diphosphatase
MARGAAWSLAAVGVSGPPIRAAGGVVWRRVDAADGEATIEVAVIHRPRYDDWSLPKGKLAAGESSMEGAVREVLEETGFHVRVGRPLGETRYEKPSSNGMRPKVVRWWAMQAEEGAFTPTREVDALEWLSLADASERMTRPTDGDVLERFARGVAPTRTVLLVRHASAGNWSEWTGDDRLRPLDDCGVAQADELARILSRFEVGRILSADNVRCEQTIAPVADALEVEVTTHPLLSEVGYPGREEEALTMLRSLGDAEHDAVACSQGGVIPDLVDRLATADGFPLERPVRAPKASTWALTIDAAGRLVDAERIDAPAIGPICGGS